MTDPTLFHDSRAIHDALPVGLCVYDRDQRLKSVNSAFFDIVGLPQGAFRPGSHFEANTRMAALQGLLGPGDPEQHVADIMQLDVTNGKHVRRHHQSGRSFSSTFMPVASGGHTVTVIDLTSILAMRDAAETASDQLHLALAGLQIGLAVFGPDGSLSLHNRRFTELLGLPATSLRNGIAFADLLQVVQHRDSHAGSVSQALRHISSDRSRSSSVRQQRGDGLVIDVRSDLLPDGGWAMTVSDISALVRAEDDARRRASMLDSIVQHIPHGITVYGPDRQATMVNAAYRVIMDGAPVEVGQSLEEIVRNRSETGEYGPGDSEAVFAMQMNFDTARPQVRRRLRPNGTTIDVRAAPLPDGGHLSVVTDVTSLITAEHELARRAKAMDAMLANIRHGIVLWDKDQRIVAANPVVEQLLLSPPGLLVPGRTLEEVIKSALDRGNLGIGQVAHDTASRLRSQDRTKSHQDQRLTKTGKVLEVRTDPTPDGGFVTTYTDVTSIRQAEQALHQARRQAEAANTAKSRFLAAMSHELQTPLSAVLASSDLIMRAASPATGHGDNARIDAAYILDAAEDAHTAARQLLSMIDTILDVARLEAGRFDLESDHVDLAQVIRACVKQSDAAAAAAELLLAIDLPEGLPSVRGDERRLRQALHHLLTNAVKFTDAGGQIRISVQRDGPQGDLLLKVSDTGIGIAEADLDRVFEPFARPEAGPIGRYPGTGLGLYVSRALMRAHGGELLLRSRPGEGTTATMLIPNERLFSSRDTQQIHPLETRHWNG